MKVALIGDIHANLPALEAVLAHAHGQGAGAIWNVGDFVGYGPFPDEVIARLRRDYALSTSGSYDRKVLRFKKRKDKWRRQKQLEKYLACQWAYERLGKKNKRYLRFLSREIRMKVQTRRVLVTHTSPGSGKESLTAETPQKRLRQIGGEAKADLVVCGHSHQAFVRQVDDVWFINPGSVGQPRDGDPRASYAILHITAGDIHVEPHRLEYDVDALVTAMRDHSLPEAFVQMALQGRDLDAILEDQV
ncbi:MAG: metallophosphoesterase family protein [Anaerolineae bacterium]|jgi:putative phosphoesterase